MHKYQKRPAAYKDLEAWQPHATYFFNNSLRNTHNYSHTQRYLFTNRSKLNGGQRLVRLVLIITEYIETQSFQWLQETKL